MESFVKTEKDLDFYTWLFGFLSVLAIGMYADLLSTLYVLSNGGKELNPFVHQVATYLGTLENALIFLTLCRCIGVGIIGFIILKYGDRIKSRRILWTMLCWSALYLGVFIPVTNLMW